MTKSANCIKDKLQELLTEQIIPSNTFSSGIWKEVII
jgi:hypothetical protein